MVHCSHQYTQVPQQATQTPQRKFLYSVQQLSAVRPFSMLLLEEPAVRQVCSSLLWSLSSDIDCWCSSSSFALHTVSVLSSCVALPPPLHTRTQTQAVAAALKSSMAVPQEPWSREFVEESVLADLAAAAPSTASLEPEGDNNSTSPSPADPGSSDAVETIPLSPAVLDLVEQYQQAAADAEGSSSDSAARQPGPKASSNRSAGTGNSKKSKAAAATALVQDTAASSSIPPELQGTLQQVQTMYGQLLQDNYVEVRYQLCWRVCLMGWPAVPSSCKQPCKQLLGCPVFLAHGAGQLGGSAVWSGEAGSVHKPVSDAAMALQCK